MQKQAIFKGSKVSQTQFDKGSSLEVPQYKAVLFYEDSLFI